MHQCRTALAVAHFRRNDVNNDIESLMRSSWPIVQICFTCRRACTHLLMAAGRRHRRSRPFADTASWHTPLGACDDVQYSWCFVLLVIVKCTFLGIVPGFVYQMTMCDTSIRYCGRFLDAVANLTIRWTSVTIRWTSVTFLEYCIDTWLHHPVCD